MEKTKADELHKSATNALQELYLRWLEEKGAIHDTVHGTLFGNAMLHRSAVFMLDVGMDEETFMKVAKECWDAANASAPRWS